MSQRAGVMSLCPFACAYASLQNSEERWRYWIPRTLLTMATTSEMSMRPSLLKSPCSEVKVTSICELAGMVQVRVLPSTLAVMSSPLRMTWSSRQFGFGVKVKVLSAPSLMLAAEILLVMLGAPLMETEPLLLHERRI